MRWAALALLALASCEVTYDPEVGALIGTPADSGAADDVDAGPACRDSDPEVAVSLALDVRPLMYRSPGGCNCHASSATSGFNLGSYQRLLLGGFNSGTSIIVPGAPCDSVLVQKLGPTPPFGSRMPFNGPPYFTPEEIALVMDWIAEGALDN